MSALTVNSGSPWSSSDALALLGTRSLLARVFREDRALRAEVLAALGVAGGSAR
jgi:hypothetical protein